MQILTTNIWLDLTWQDPKLAWNSSQYGGITDIRIPPHKLWKPDLLLYNCASENFDSTYPTNLIVSNTGQVDQIPPGIFRSTCKIDITWFPFDTQTCELKFGTWTYNGFKVNLTNKQDTAETSGFSANGEWDLIDAPAVRTEEFYTCCPEPYIDITFFLQMRRRTLYYFSNLIVPCVLIASMAVLGFNFPPDSGEKVTLEITILMSLTFFMNIVSDMQPPSSETPLIGTYFSCIMIMVASSVVCTIMILNYHHRLASNHQMPPWIAAVFLQWLPWLLRMSRPGRRLTRKSINLNSKMARLERGDRGGSKSLLTNVLDMDDDYIAGGLAGNDVSDANINQFGLNPANNQLSDGNLNKYNLNPIHNQPLSGVRQSRTDAWLDHNNYLDLNSYLRSQGDVGGSPESFSPGLDSPGMDQRPAPGTLERELQGIRRELSVIADKIRLDAEAARVESEWKFAAMVLDRLCLFAFTAFTLVLSAAVLISAPHVFVL